LFGIIPKEGPDTAVDIDIGRPIGASGADHDLVDQFPDGSVGVGTVVLVGLIQGLP
jgi:hypothetical protein